MKTFINRHVDRLGILMGAVFMVGMAFMAQTLLDTDRPCLRFSGIIELHVDGVEAGARSCQDSSRFHREEFPEQMVSMINEINSLRPVEAVLPSSQRGVFVTVTHRDPFFLLFSERSLILGSELASHPLVFKRILLSALAFQNSSGESSLVKEVRADLLWYFYAGDEHWIDPTSGAAVTPSQWLSLAAAPRTVREYCSNPLRQVYDLSFCRFELDKDRPLAFEKSYEPVIAWSVYRLLQEEGISTSSTYLRKFFESTPVPASKEKSADSENAEVFVKTKVAQFFNPSKETLPLLQARLERLWKPLRISSPGSFDFVVEVEDASLKDGVLNSLTEWQKNTFSGRFSKILVVDEEHGGEQLELPLARPVHYVLDQVRSKTHLILGCHLPRIRRVASLQASNLIALKVCQSSDLPQWADILKEGAHQTADVWMELHLPSLRRWSRHRPKILALNQPLDRVFCRPELFKGYPFTVKNCAGIQ